MFSTAARAAPEWTIPGIPWCGERVTLTTLPERCGMKALVAAACVICQVPWTFSSVTVRKPLAVIASAGLMNWPPALFTSTSRRPCRSITPSNSRSTASASRMSIGSASATPPASPIACTTSAQRLRAPSAADDRRAQRCELDRDGSAKPGAGAGDDAHSPVQQPWAKDLGRCVLGHAAGAYPRQGGARTPSGSVAARPPPGTLSGPHEGPHRAQAPRRAAAGRLSRGHGHRSAALRRRGGVPARLLRAPGRPLREPEDDRPFHLTREGLDLGPVPSVPDHSPHGGLDPGRHEPPFVDCRGAARELRPPRLPARAPADRVRQGPSVSAEGAGGGAPLDPARGHDAPAHGPRLGDVGVPVLHLRPLERRMDRGDDRGEAAPARLPAAALRQRVRLPAGRLRRATGRLLFDLRADLRPVRGRQHPARLHPGPHGGAHVRALPASRTATS